MKRFRPVIGALCALFAAGALAGEATVYTHRDFDGTSLTLHNGADANLRDNGIGNVGSIVVHSGRWEFCARPGFRGPCEQLGPGRYSSLTEDWSHPVASMREVTPGVVYGPEHARPGYGRPDYAAIEVFPGPRFRGPGAAFDRSVWNLGRRGLDNRISSLVVNEGEWELCTEPRFEGFCRVFGPGEYPRLGRRLDDNVNSLRRIG